MLKKFALIAAAAAVLVACGGDENTEALEQQAKEAEATANELLDQVSAGAETATDAAGAVVDSVASAAEGAVEEVKEAAH